MDLDSARAALEEAKIELNTGLITPASYHQLEVALNEALHQTVSLTQLSSTSHTALEYVPEDDLPDDLGRSSPAGYLSLEHEEEYLNTLDAAYDASVPRHRGHLDSHPIRSYEKKEDVALRNPVSVYNWLRKNQPQVFLQDSDSPPEKTALKTSTPRALKRSSLVPKQEAEILDEEGNLLTTSLEGSSRSKRKREDEPYRPKGGSSRPSKRKKTGSGYSDRKDIAEDETT